MEIKGVIKKGYEYLTRFIFLVAPFIVLTIFLIFAKIYDLAPIGNKTIAWCDMNQQLVPLLNMFKDVLEGKKSFTYNLSIAGGMSFFGVFFFFLSTPLSFLVVFVDKVDMMGFVNVLVMIKMMLIALTFGYYLRKKYKNLNNLFVIAFQLLFAFSGYVMMYYQNCIWLDVIIMFPLLMLGCDRVLENKTNIFYIIYTALTVMINYYLGIIVIFFVILYMGINVFAKRKEENIKAISLKFVTGSIIAMLVAMVVLIPSLFDYADSARTTSIIESLMNSWFTTSYVTTIPLILGTIIILPLFFIKGNPSNKKVKIILLILLSIPLILDPINKMWHFGSYQSFPCRFAFINTFLFLDIASMFLDSIDEIKFTKVNIIKWSVGLIISISGIVYSFIFENKYIEKKINDLSNYPRTLWGNTTSFEALLRYYVIILFVVVVIFILFKSKIVSKRTLGLSFVSLSILEAMFSFRIYMVVPSNDTKNYEDFYKLSEVIKDDDSFYRVKTSRKIRNVNDLGALGYNTLGHYTSLTREDYMNAIKKLGYSSYWMEVGPYDGSIFTDALLMNKYTITTNYAHDYKYTSEGYYVVENDVFPLGIVTNNDLSKESELKGKTRSEMQEKIYSTLIDSSSSLHTFYSPENELTYRDERYNIPGGNVKYSINVNEKQTLYFEAFDKYNSSLGQAINETMTVLVNNNIYRYNYPSQSDNGSLYLGTFENETVNVEIRVSKNITCSSFSIFGINNELLKNKIDTVNHANVEYKNNKFIGNYVSEEGDEYVFLPIAYNRGIKARINGRNAKVYRVFDGFTAIKLNKGNNKIEVSFVSRGLGGGIALSSIGIALFGLYIIFVEKKKKVNIENKITKEISYYGTLVLCSIMFVILYIIPIVINVIGQIR